MAKKKGNKAPGVPFLSGKKRGRPARSKEDEPPIGVIPPTTTPVEPTEEQSARAKPHVKKQAEFDDPSFALPPAIQGIDNAADELFEVLDNLTSLKERREVIKANIHGLMRAAGRKIYKYRDREIRIEGKEQIKVQSPKTRKIKKVRGVKITRTTPEE